MKNIPITNRQEIDELINSIKVCHVGFSDNDTPYVLPFNFGYDNEFVYLHSAKTGRKIQVLKNNNKVCISMQTDSVLNIRDESVACSYSMKFRSVIIDGKVEIIDDINEKCRIMNIIMNHYTGKEDFNYNFPAINNVEIMKVIIENISARKRGYC
jgi:nitroimidazol reductase NimA-like FMN-containing flavoprotein (pyridoxamine 5'-phosphate oxidase superfamily)